MIAKAKNQFTIEIIAENVQDQFFMANMLHSFREPEYWPERKPMQPMKSILDRVIVEIYNETNHAYLSLTDYLKDRSPENAYVQRFEIRCIDMG